MLLIWYALSVRTDAESLGILWIWKLLLLLVIGINVAAVVFLIARWHYLSSERRRAVILALLFA